MTQTTIGLFGTCGNSKWRDMFMANYDALGIPYYNPNDPNWTPENAVVESQHLKSDDIILFPVTGETFGTASLGEIGFSILSAVRADTNRYVIVYIDPELATILVETEPARAKDSKNARQILLAHLRAQNYSNVFVVYNLNDMLHASLKLYVHVEQMKNLRERFPHG